jgi:hypothetical protein
MIFWIGLFIAADLDVGAGQRYATISDAVAVAMPGDVVHVHPGTYAESLDLAGSGAKGMPIRIESVEAGMAILQGTIGIGGSDWEIVGLTIQAPAGDDTIEPQGARILLEGLEVSGGDRDAVDGGGTDVTIRDCSIHDMDNGDNDAHCIVLNPGAERWTIENNELYDCSGDGVQLYSDDVERSILDTRIVGNLIYKTGAIARMENAIDVKNGEGILIRGNVMYGFDTNKTLVFQKGPAQIEVSCNDMRDGFTGVEFRGEDGGTIEGVVFAHNLMAGYDQYTLKFDGTVGAEIYNNTFVDVVGDGLRLEIETLQQGIVRNNLWVNASEIENDGDMMFDHNGFWNVESNGIASDSDVNADPLLDADHRLMPGSPMIDAGVDVGLPAAGNAPDIGWDEVDGDPCGDVPGGDDTGGSDSSSDDGTEVGTGPDTAEGPEGSDTNGDDATGPGDGPSDDTAGGLTTAATDGDDGSAADDEGGCGCRSGGGPMSAILGVFALGIVRRRARARVSATR